MHNIYKPNGVEILTSSIPAIKTALVVGAGFFTVYAGFHFYNAIMASQGFDAAVGPNLNPMRIAAKGLIWAGDRVGGLFRHEPPAET